MDTAIRPVDRIEIKYYDTKMDKGKFIEVIKAISKSLGVNIIGIVVGFLQLITLFLLTSLNNRILDVDKIFVDGVILFFCSAFIVASVVEYYSIKIRYPKLFEAVFFIAVPMIMIFLIIILYSGAVAFSKPNMGLLRGGTIICFITAVVHSLIFRAIKIYLGRDL